MNYKNEKYRRREFITARIIAIKSNLIRVKNYYFANFFPCTILLFILLFELFHRTIFLSEFLISLFTRDSHTHIDNLLIVFNSNVTFIIDSKEIVLFRKILLFYLNLVIVALLSHKILSEMKKRNFQNIQRLLMFENIILEFSFALSFIVILQINDISEIIFILVFVCISMITLEIARKVNNNIRNLSEMKNDSLLNDDRKILLLDVILFIVFFYFGLYLVFNVFATAFTIQSGSILLRKRVLIMLVIGSFTYLFHFFNALNISEINNKIRNKDSFILFLFLTITFLAINFFYYLSLFQFN
jgi:hypothetical protein